MGGEKDQDWRKMADTHKMTPEEVRAAGVEGSKRPPGHKPGTTLHQVRSLPFSTKNLVVGGMLITFAVGYVVLYSTKKPEATAIDVAKVSTGLGSHEDTHPRK